MLSDSHSSTRTTLGSELGCRSIENVDASDRRRNRLKICVIFDDDSEDESRDWRRVEISL